MKHHPASRNLLIFLFFLLFNISALAQTTPLNVQQSTVTITLTPGQTRTGTFTLQNTGTSPLNPTLDISSLDLVDNDGDSITLTFSPEPLGTLAPGQSLTVTVSATADPRIDFETFGGTVTVRDPNVPGAQDTFQLLLNVRPDVCDFGQTPNGLELEIEEPDEGKEYEPGDKINIQTTVSNTGLNDQRVQAEAFLFTEGGREIAAASSKTKNVEDGNDEDFDFSLTIPSKAEILGDADDTFTIYIKAFNDDNEQLACTQESVTIDLELPTRKLLFLEGSTKIVPSTLTCGETAIATVGLLNVGEKDNTATINLQNRDLKIFQQVPNVQLENFASEEDNTIIRQIPFKIPENTPPKDYIFILKVDYNGGSLEKELRLNVASCKGGPQLPPTGIPGTDFLQIPEKRYGVPAGKTFTIPVELTNDLEEKQFYEVLLRDVGDFGQGSTRSTALNPGQTTTLFLELRVREDAEPGTYSGTIAVTSEKKLVASETVTVDVKAREESIPLASTTTFLEKIPIGFWILMNVLLISLAIVSVKIITASR